MAYRIEEVSLCRVKEIQNGYSVDLDGDYHDFSLKVTFDSDLDYFLRKIPGERLFVAFEGQAIIALINNGDIYYNCKDSIISLDDIKRRFEIQNATIMDYKKRKEGYSILLNTSNNHLKLEIRGYSSEYSFLFALTNNCIIDELVGKEIKVFIVDGSFILALINNDSEICLIRNNFYNDGEFIELNSNIYYMKSNYDMDEEQIIEEIKELLNEKNPIKKLMV